MSHVESAGQAVSRLKYSAVRHERTVGRAGDDADRVGRADIHHLMTVHNTRRQVRYNGAIDRMDRAVLGTSGSPETLARFRELAKDIGGRAGQPVVVVEARNDEGVQQAVAGELDGSVHIRDQFSAGKSGRGVMRSYVGRPHQEASLQAGTEPLIRFTRNEDDWRIAAVVGRERAVTHVSVADIVLDEVDPFDDPEADMDPEHEFVFTDRVAEGAVFLGGEAIKGSELFEPDLKTIVSLAGMTV